MKNRQHGRNNTVLVLPGILTGHDPTRHDPTAGRPGSKEVYKLSRDESGLVKRHRGSGRVVTKLLLKCHRLVQVWPPVGHPES